MKCEVKRPKQQWKESKMKSCIRKRHCLSLILWTYCAACAQSSSDRARTLPLSLSDTESPAVACSSKSCGCSLLQPTWTVRHSEASARGLQCTTHREIAAFNWTKQTLAALRDSKTPCCRERSWGSDQREWLRLLSAVGTLIAGWKSKLARWNKHSSRSCLRWVRIKETLLIIQNPHQPLEWTNVGFEKIKTNITFTCYV